MPNSTKPQIAVIGLGSMGFGMATSLRRKGFEVTGYDVSTDRSRALSPKAARAPRRRRRPPKAPASSSVWSSTPPRPRSVLFGKDGVVETLASDAVFVSSATMDPEVARRLAKQLESTGRHYLDAPISGGAQRAAQGELTILASGSAGRLRQGAARARCDGGKAL